MTDVLQRPSAKGGSPAGPRPDGAGAPLYDTAAVLLRHARLMILVPAVTFAIAVAFAWSSRDYAATARITPQNEQPNLSSLMGVAAQLGVANPVGRQNESVDFYADLIKSREILDSVALTTFRFTAGRDDTDTLSGTYIDLNQIKGRNDYDRIYRARRMLDRKVTTTLKRTSGLVTIQTRAKWGRLAEQMNRRILELVNQFNLQRRQTAARAEREFLDRRLADIKSQLEDAQGALRSFQERNRSWQSDPALSLDMLNRQRRVDVAKQAYE
ncbi:MAG: hypothetical protein HY700_14405, partial [Gemmatimonadetes bacterium]|nr:hypothetical protein [Gemmatimonadota bacterium]